MADTFDNIIEGLVMAGAEGGTYSLLSKEVAGVTYLHVDASDRMDGTVDVTLYTIPSKADFVTRVRDLLGEEINEFDGIIDPHDDNHNTAIWDVLARYLTITFSEY